MVVERKPSGGKKAAPKGQIELLFDQPMDAALTAGAWQVITSDGESVPGQVEWPTPERMTFTPAQSLQSGVVYLASLSEKAASTAGKPLSEAYRFSFGTAEPLQVSQVLPANMTSDVQVKGTITVIFNRPVVPLVIAEEQDGLPQPLVIDPPVDGKGEWLNTSVYIYRPRLSLLGGQTYQVTVPAGLQDAQGESLLEQDYTWSFSTVVPSIERLLV